MTGRASRDWLGHPTDPLMPTKHVIARDLAAALLSGTWSPEDLVRRGAQACGRRERWLRPLIRRLFAAFGGGGGGPPGPPAAFIYSAPRVHPGRGGHRAGRAVPPPRALL